VVTKWLLEVLNVPPATLEIKPRVNQKSLVSRPAIGFIISGAPHFHNPYLTKVTNQLGSTLRRPRHPVDISRAFEITKKNYKKKNTKLLTLYNNKPQHQETNIIKNGTNRIKQEH
jgi:hypothetical protein